MIIKVPFVPDVSTYNATIDWSKVEGVAAIIAKASEGFLLEDNQFGSNWTQAGRLGKPRAAYHFFRGFWPSAWQAKKFVSTLNKYGGTKPGDKVILDAEENGMSLGAIVDCMYNIEFLTGLPCILYSRAELLNNLSVAKLTQPQRDWLKARPVWTAGYPLNPDVFDAPPAGYIPDPARYGPVVLWQYSDKPTYPGIPGACDVNWIDPAFLAQWVQDTAGTPPAPPVPPPPPAANSTYDVTGDPAANIRSDPSFPADDGNLAGFALKGSELSGTPTADGKFVALSGFVALSVLAPHVDPPPTPEPPPAPAPVPTALNLYRQVYVFQRPADFKPINVFRIPDVMAGRLASVVYLTKELQEYWFALLMQNKPGSFTLADMKAAWRSLTTSDRAFTNFAGTDKFRDYISGTNTDQGDPKMDKYRACGGNVVNVLRDANGNEIHQRVAGVDCLRVEAIDPASHPDPLKINHKLTPHLVHLATIDFTETVVGAFPQLDGNDVQVPCFGIGGFNALPVACLEKVDTSPSPYLPPRS